MEIEVRKIVVIVEDVEIARTALQWALHNLLRYGDLITLLHVFPKPTSKNKNKVRLQRLKGFQLALSFKDLCVSNYPNTKTEIVVTEGDEEGGKISDLVKQIGPYSLVLGLHDQSFLYRLAMAHRNVVNYFNCKVLAIKQPTPLTTKSISLPDSPASANMEFSQIDISPLSVPVVPPPKIPYQICPDPSGILWRTRRRSPSSAPDVPPKVPYQLCPDPNAIIWRTRRRRR